MANKIFSGYQPCQLFKTDVSESISVRSNNGDWTENRVDYTHFDEQNKCNKATIHGKYKAAHRKRAMAHYTFFYII
jgi:hypothetical protein